MAYEYKVSGKGSMENFLNLKAREIREECEIIMEDVIEDAVKDQKRLIDQAETPWGRLRKSQGRASAGRRETDRMYDAVTGDVDPGPKQVEGRWGWLFDFEKYFEYQDAGTGKIAAANSMADSFVKAVENVKKRLNDSVRRRV